MAEIIIEKSANDVWKVAADKLLNEKNLLDGRNGEYREILHTFITIKDPRQKWVYNRVPAISIAYALAEIVWILNGDNAAKIINYWLRSWFHPGDDEPMQVLPSHLRT